MAIDQTKLQELLGRAVVDIGANFHAALVVTGDKLGLFRALRELGPSTPADLANRTNTHERYVREWLSAMAAGGYVTYETASEKFSLSEEQALALLDADLPGAFLLAQATVKSEPRITEAFRSGKGVGWHEHDPACSRGRSGSSGRGTRSLSSPMDPGARGRPGGLEEGGQVADVGCGHGASTLLMARAFPASRFVGFDYHQGSIDGRARSRSASGWTTASASRSRARRTTRARTTTSWLLRLAPRHGRSGRHRQPRA